MVVDGGLHFDSESAGSPSVASDAVSHASVGSVLMQDVFGNDLAGTGDGNLALETLMVAIEPFARSSAGSSTHRFSTFIVLWPSSLLLCGGSLQSHLFPFSLADSSSCIIIHLLRLCFLAYSLVSGAFVCFIDFCLKRVLPRFCLIGAIDLATVLCRHCVY